MSSSSENTDETEASKKLEPSHPQYSFDGVIGLEDEKEKFESAFLQRVERGRFGGIHGHHYAVVRGPVGGGLQRFAEGMIDQVSALGFTPYRIDPSHHDQPVDLIEDAIEQTPAVVFIEDLEELASSYNEFQNLHQRVREDGASVVFVGAIQCVSGHGYVPHSFVEEDIQNDDITITIPPLDAERRIAVLEEFLSTIGSETGSDIDISDAERETIGRVSDDFSVNELKKVVSRVEASCEGRVDSSSAVTASLVVEAIEDVVDESPRLSEFNNSEEGIPDVTFEDIGGLSEAIDRLTSHVVAPLEHPERFEELNLDRGAGAVMYGPPGTGKTMLAKAVANATDRYFVNIEGGEITDKFFGESEKNLQRKFTEARDNAPSLVFIDELDSLAPQRGEVDGCGAEERIVTQLLRELDGLESRGDVFVLGSTNRPERVDDAVLRPGRLGDEHIQVLPASGDEKQAEVLEIHLRDRPVADDVTPEWIAAKLPEELPGAVLENICDKAASEAVYPLDKPPEITREDVRTAIEAAEWRWNQQDGQNSRTFY